MEFKKVYCFSNNWLWILVSEGEVNYFYRFDEIPDLMRIEKREREKEARIIADLAQMNILIVENKINGFYLSQKLKEEKWAEYLCQNYYLDPTIKKHTVNL